MTHLIMDHPATRYCGTSYVTCSGEGPIAFLSLSVLILQILVNKGHFGKGRTLGHGRLQRL
jgi:hypothetical protein